MPMARIHWKVSDAERITIKRMIRLVDEEFKRLELPTPQGVPRLDELNEWIASSTEKAHPTGTTRMAANPTEGVVDANCQVHGVRGLFISGSSIFPTSGAANPTLMIVATAIRLADHLKSLELRATGTGGGTQPISLRERYKKRAQMARSTEAIKVGFVGAGGRISSVYLPILQQMPDRYGIVGFTAFSPRSFQRFESSTGIDSFPNPRRLIEEAKPELLILAVPDRLNEQVLTELLEFKVPILAETPVAWSVSGTQRIIEKAANLGTVLGVGEQFPFLPREQFRKQLVRRGLLGEIYAVLNDFEGYSYHAFAQLRCYLKGQPSCCRCTEFDFRVPPADGLDGLMEHWQTGSVIFDDGTLLHHHFACPDRGFSRSTRIFGTLGSIDNDEIHLIRSGKTETFHAIRRESSPGQLASISAELGEIGHVSWENPFAPYPFSDEQIAVASILNGMSRAAREGIPPLYTARDFLTDIQIVEAFRYSAGRNGADIDLPFTEWKQKTLQLTNAGYWKRKLSQR